MKKWLAVFLASMSMGQACTDFVLQARDQTYVNGRSLEFAIPMETKIKVFPRGDKRASKNPDQKKSLSWVSQYGHLSSTCLGKDFVLDGMNEKGLSFGFLWLPGTEYPTVKAQEMKKALDFTDLGSWILGNFASVAEVKAALKDVVVWGHEVPPLPGIPPVHVAVHDASGNHLVIEFIKGEMKVYDNPNTVLTNAPPFDWHLINLNNYLNLRAVNAGEVKLGSMVLAPPGQGSGMLGIPGDWSPPSRFVRTTTFLHFAKQAENADAGVILAAHLLNTVDIPLGEVRDTNKSEDYTQWIVIKDLTNKVFYFRSYNDLCLKKIEFKKVDFTVPSNAISIDLEEGNKDVSSLLQRAS